MIEIVRNGAHYCPRVRCAGCQELIEDGQGNVLWATGGHARMTLTPSMLLARLRSAGVELRLGEGDKLGVKGRRSDVELDLLRAHKAEVMRLLKEESSYSLANSEWEWTPGAAMMTVRSEPDFDPRCVAFTLWRFKHEPDPEQQAQVEALRVATTRASDLVSGGDRAPASLVGDDCWHLIVPRGDEQVIRTALLAAERGEYEAIADYVETESLRRFRHHFRRTP